MREIEVFLPFSVRIPPTETAREMVEVLNVANALIGTDILTGSITVKLPYTPVVWEDACAFLSTHGVPYEIKSPIATD